MKVGGSRKGTKHFTQRRKVAKHARWREGALIIIIGYDKGQFLSDKTQSSAQSVFLLYSLLSELCCFAPLREI
jgi:hypothetical protein